MTVFQFNCEIKRKGRNSAVIMFPLVVVLPSVFVLAGAWRDCPSLYDCEGPIRAENIFADTDSVVFKIEDLPTYNRVCGKLSAFKSCYNRHIGSCDNQFKKTDAHFFKDIIQYICAPMGMPVALDTRKATCLINPDLENWFLSMMYTCVVDFRKEVDQATIGQGLVLTKDQKCEFKGNLDTCIKSNMNKKCGPEMATLIEKMWAMWSVYDYADYKVCAKSSSTLPGISIPSIPNLPDLPNIGNIRVRRSGWRRR